MWGRSRKKIEETKPSEPPQRLKEALRAHRAVVDALRLKDGMAARRAAEDILALAGSDSQAAKSRLRE